MKINSLSYSDNNENHYINIVFSHCNLGLQFALAIKVIFIGLGLMGLATMWEAVFADVGVALAAIFNATRVLK
jgi:cation transport ATPase